MISNDTKGLIQAIEENQGEFRLSLGRNRKSVERIDDKLKWIIGGSRSPSYNCIFDAHLSSIEADAEIKESIRKFQTRRVSGSWQIGESMQPIDLGERLEKQGFAHIEDIIGMSLDIEKKDIKSIKLPGIKIRRVNNQEHLILWLETMMRGFGKVNKEGIRWYANSLSNAGYKKGNPWNLYIAYLDGKPVATSSLFVGKNACGIYLVATTPEVRGKGIGTLITNVALIEAKRQRQKLCVLQATKMGYPVYEKLGFIKHCTMSFFLWNYQKNYKVMPIR